MAHKYLRRKEVDIGLSPGITSTLSLHCAHCLLECPIAIVVQKYKPAGAKKVDGI